MAADPRDPFSRFREERPRLMATPEHIQRVKDAIAGDPVGEALKYEIIRKADKYVEKERPPTLSDRESDDFLAVCRLVRKRMQTLGLAWLLVKDKRYVTRAKQELAAACAFRDWNPLHFLDTAELTHAVAIGYDWFHARLSANERGKIAAAIIEKGLKPGYAQLTHGPKRTWPNQATNWNIVCNSGLMIGALAVWGEGEPPGDFPEQVFRRCLDSVPTGFSGYSPDGSWDEGPGYWAYATEYAAYLLSALKTALGHEFGLASLPGFSKSGFFRMHAQGSAAGEDIATKFFNFSDSQEERSGSWSMRWLYHRFGKSGKKPFDAYNLVALADAQESPMDLFWYSKDRPTVEGIPRNVVFRGIANVAMLRGYWEKKSGGFKSWEAADAGDVYLGIRAGENSRDGVHAHLDLGSFVLDASKVRWAMDIQPLGAKAGSTHKADYKLPGYFDVELERRFRYYRTGTIGHNTLVVNGFNQALGAQTEIVGFGQSSEDNPELVVVVLDLTAAYPDCIRVRRGFALIEQKHVLIVDEFIPKQDMNVRWQMHTEAAAEVRGPVVRLTQEHKGERKEFFVRLVEPADVDGVDWEIQEARGTQPKEGPNDKIRKLAAALPDVKGPTRISVYLSATRNPNARLPEPLERPLWAWIEWTEKEHPAEKGKTSY